MAKCDQGYLCEVCGEPVKNIIESSLYLRYVLGEVAVHQLFSTPERHLKCDPDLSRFIVHEKFESSNFSELYEQDSMSEKERKEKQKWVTAGWVRLREVVQLGIPITEYPLPDSLPD